MCVSQVFSNQRVVCSFPSLGRQVAISSMANELFTSTDHLFTKAPIRAFRTLKDAKLLNPAVLINYPKYSAEESEFFLKTEMAACSVSHTVSVGSLSESLVVPELFPVVWWSTTCFRNLKLQNCYERSARGLPEGK